MPKGKTDSGNLLTATKLAAAWGVKPTALKKKLQEAGVEPDHVRCGCAYYDKTRLEKMRKKLGL